MSIRRHFLFLDHHDKDYVETYGHSPGDCSPEPLDLTGQHPPHQPDAVGALVVAGDGNIDELGGRVDVAEGDHGDVGVASLGDGLVVSPGVRHHQEAGLAERGLDLISEGAGGEATGDGTAAGIPRDKNRVLIRNRDVKFKRRDNVSLWSVNY